ncbi:MAG: IclR family transcriptional regulator [Corynebacterium sp.]|nr:IclR family transcriptional regulator [Corynebacterium sp.]
MGQFNEAESGIKVLDRAALILNIVADKPLSLAQLCEKTGLPRATAHRLATALEVHGFLGRTNDGRWDIGAGITSLAARGGDSLIDAASPVMTAVMEETGESVQLYKLTGLMRTCVASVEPPSGLQNTVPVGSRMPLSAGSSGKIFLAFGSQALRDSVAPQAVFQLSELENVRRLGFAESVGEREPGLASVSVPIHDPAGNFLAALSVSGPVERLRPHPGALWGDMLKAASARLTASL